MNDEEEFEAFWTKTDLKHTYVIDKENRHWLSLYEEDHTVKSKEKVEVEILAYYGIYALGVFDFQGNSIYTGIVSSATGWSKEFINYYNRLRELNK